MSTRTLKLGARGSLLSRLQSEWVARRLESLHAGLRVDICPITTTGDRITDRPLHELGGKGLFTKELEIALLDRNVDFVVHSFKDVPVTMPLVDVHELVIAAVPVREDPRDLLACATARTIADLPAAAKVGTGSLRRQAQMLAIRRDLQMLPIRGNVDTRIRKLLAGDFDAVVLAVAGVRRSGLFTSDYMTPVPVEQMLPAAAQGALALQCREDAAEIRELLASLHDPTAALAAKLEREVVRLLNGDCTSPIAALAEIQNNQITLTAAVAKRSGQPPVIRAHASAPINQFDSLPPTVVKALVAQGAKDLLKHEHV